MAYPLPSWLQAARPAPLYAQGIGLGLQAAEQQQQAALRQQALMQQAAQQQQEAMLASQRMAVQEEMAQQEMALKSAELGVSQQELSQRNAVNQMKIEEASRLASAQQEYRARVAAGEPGEKVLAEMGPALGSGMDSAYAALIRGRMSPQEGPAGPVQGQPLLSPEGTPVPNVTMYRSASGAWIPYHDVPQAPPMTEQKRIDTSLKIQGQIDKLYSDNRNLNQDQPNPDWSESTKNEWQRGKASLKFYQGKLDALQGVTPQAGTATIGGLGQGEPATPDTEAPPLNLGRVSIGGPRTSTLSGPALAWPTQEAGTAVLPMPATKAALMTGSVYQTKFGPMEWNGSKFVKP